MTLIEIFTSSRPPTNASVSLVHFLQNIRPSVTLELERDFDWNFYKFKTSCNRRGLVDKN